MNCMIYLIANTGVIDLYRCIPWQYWRKYILIIATLIVILSGHMVIVMIDDNVISVITRSYGIL